MYTICTISSPNTTRLKAITHLVLLVFGHLNIYTSTKISKEVNELDFY